MPVDPRRLPLAKLRRRLLDGGEPVTPHLLRKLQRDPRRGVRQLYLSLQRRVDEEKQRQAHRDGLLNFERVLWRSGVERIAGVDEAGVGPLAGPVVAAAVVFRRDVDLAGIDDSKKLDPPSRERLDAAIRATAAGVAIGVAEVEEIDRVNVYQAALLAMRRAVEALPVRPQHLLVDARDVPGVAVPQNQFHKGDGINYSIAAASIVAKVYRDRLMVELDRRWPGYGFARHKGYCTSSHQGAIRRLGPCPAHRRSFTFIQELCGEYSADFYDLRRRLYEAADPRALGRLEAELGERRLSLREVEYRKLRLTLTRRWKVVTSPAAPGRAPAPLPGG
ncbi:MAG TPA: ribonuclease HII [Thermoanaerobaculia bacterium]|nr:ribonuclease HII [Thermoanaerobaculia bacterium]